jgi:Fe2+ transport system protein FeoA
MPWVGAQRAFSTVEGSSVQMVLSELKAGQSAVIDRIGGSGALRRRILEMGMVKGTRVYVEKYAPLKDPLELIVKGTHVTLRVEEAAHMSVIEVDDQERR